MIDDHTLMLARRGIRNAAASTLAVSIQQGHEDRPKTRRAWDTRVEARTTELINRLAEAQAGGTK